MRNSAITLACVFLLFLGLWTCSSAKLSTIPESPNTDGEEEGADSLPFRPAGPDAAPDPMELGPFPVGVTTLDFRDESRPNAKSGKARFLRAEIWYPAFPPGKDAKRRVYDLKKEADENIDLGDKREAFMVSDIPLIPSEAYADAPINGLHGPYPVILFSHGANSSRFQYLFLTVHLASHGYFVVAADHEGNTLWDALREGINPSSMIASASDRLADMTFLANQMEKIAADPGHPWHGLIDLEQMALAGHSFGGFTVMAAACADSRFRLVLALAPLIGYVESFDCPLEYYPAPLLLIGGTADETIVWKSQYCGYRRVSSFKMLVAMLDAGHFTFSDLCDWEFAPPDSGGADLLKDGCTPEVNLPHRQGQKLARHYATAFFNAYLRGSAASEAFIRNDPSPPFDVAEVFKGDTLPDWPDGGCGN